MSLRQRITSFRHAIRGIFTVIRTQPNAWIHLVATVGVVGLGLLLNLSHAEWIALVLSIGMVWSAEALNTAVEFLCDEVSQEQRERIGIAKDCGAAGVLLAAMAAAVVGGIVFVPHLLALMER